MRWRLKSLRITTRRAVAPVTANVSGTATSMGDYHVGVGWANMDSTKFSSTPAFNSVTQLSVYRGSSGDVVLNIPRRELRGEMDWYETTGTGSESDAFQSCGTGFVSIYLNSGFTTSVTHVYIEGVIEFQDRIDSSVSFALKKHIAEPPCAVVDDEKSVSACDFPVACGELREYGCQGCAARKCKRSCYLVRFEEKAGLAEA